MKCPFYNKTMESCGTETKKKIHNYDGDSLKRYHQEIHRKFICNSCGAELEHSERPLSFLEIRDPYNEIDRICRLIKAKLRRLYPNHSIFQSSSNLWHKWQKIYKPANLCRDDEDREEEKQIEDAIYQVVKNNKEMICSIITPVFLDYMRNNGMRIKKNKFTGKINPAARYRLNYTNRDFNWKIKKYPKLQKQIIPPKPNILGE